MEENKKFKILSISGGGIRGVMPITVLSELEKESGKKITEMFDLIVGTSTGGIVASSLGYGYSPDEIHKLYFDKGQEIFYRSFWYKLVSVFGLFNAKYKKDGLVNSLTEFLGNKTIRSSLVDIMTTSYNTTKSEIRLFKSWKKEDSYYTFAEIALATASAPTYFPSYKLYPQPHWPEKNNFIDGGIYSNSPVEVAWIEGIKKGFKPEDIVILSLGTGEKKYRQYDTTNWGIFSWLKKRNETPLLDMVFDGIKEKDHYITSLLFPKFYHLDTIIPDDFKMDKADQKTLSQLTQLGRNISKQFDYQSFLIENIY